MNRRASAPFHGKYQPNTDVSKELDEIMTNCYQYQVGILRLMVKLGIIDIIKYYFMLTSHVDNPRFEHLGAVLNVFLY